MLIVLAAAYILYLVILRIKARTLGQDFDQVKDLVRGTVHADIKDLWSAYSHFKKMKGVRIGEVNETEWEGQMEVWKSWRGEKGRRRRVAEKEGCNFIVLRCWHSALTTGYLMTSPEVITIVLKGVLCSSNEC